VRGTVSGIADAAIAELVLTIAGDMPGNDPIPAGHISAAAESAARILVVEDEFLVAMMLENDLNDAGFNVVGLANSAEKAVAMAKAERPDLIIMDIRLIGERDGIDAATQIYGETGIRCMFATAQGDQQSRARAEAARPIGWLQKPYGRAALLVAVHQALAALKN
jgi:CheY-like chemotaxis protein